MEKTTTLYDQRRYRMWFWIRLSGANNLVVASVSIPQFPTVSAFLRTLTVALADGIEVEPYQTLSGRFSSG